MTWSIYTEQSKRQANNFLQGFAKASSCTERQTMAQASRVQVGNVTKKKKKKDVEVHHRVAESIRRDVSWMTNVTELQSALN